MWNYKMSNKAFYLLSHVLIIHHSLLGLSAITRHVCGATVYQC